MGNCFINRKVTQSCKGGYYYLFYKPVKIKALVPVPGGFFLIDLILKAWLCLVNERFPNKGPFTALIFVNFPLL